MRPVLDEPFEARFRGNYPKMGAFSADSSGVPDEFAGATGGGRGIRTLGTVARTTVFETAPFNHSGTPPAKRRAT